MDYTTAGVILFTENYEACVQFYGTVLALPLMHSIDREHERLTVFSLGTTYLMVETGGVAHSGPKSLGMSPIKIRFNVPDVAEASERLMRKGLKVDIRNHSWGTTAEFTDPDGNRCALRSDAGWGITTASPTHFRSAKRAGL